MFTSGEVSLDDVDVDVVPGKSVVCSVNGSVSSVIVSLALLLTLTSMDD